MDSAKKAQLNRRAPDGTHPSTERPGAPAVAPDSMLLALGKLLTPQLLEYGSFPDDFIAAGYSDADLVLSPTYTSATTSYAFMAATLTWDPHASPGEPGHWNWESDKPLIVDRLMTALYALCLKPEMVDGVFFPGTHRRAQVVLNEVLLEHPVLMHPRVRVPAYNYGGSCSVAHAIAMSPYGHFPMARDWPDGQAPMEKLTEWARHRLVRRVLRTAVRSVGHEGEAPEVHRRSWFASGMKARKSHAGLLASLFEVGKLMSSGAGNAAHVGDILVDWKALHRPEDGIHEKDAIAEALFQSAELSHSNSLFISDARLYAVPSFAEYVAALHEDERQRLEPEMCHKLFRNIFGATKETLSSELIEHNTRALMSTFSKARVFKDEWTAADWMRSVIRKVGPPSVDAASALAFIRTMREFEVQITEADFPRGSSLNAIWPGWAHAIQADVAENAMLSVLGKASDTPPPIELAAAPATQRRRRASL